MRRMIVAGLDHACSVVDRLPWWTYWPVKRWLGCPSGLALWSARLDDRWQTDRLGPPDHLSRHRGP